MEPNYLSVEEIDWELRIRGAVVQGNCQVKRSILRGHLQSEKIVPVSYPAVQLDIELEKTICQDKISALESLVTLFAFDKRHPDYKRILTKLIHAKNRVNYFSNNDQVTANLKTKLYSKIMILFDQLETKASNLNEIDLLTLNIDNDNLPPNSSNIPESNISNNHLTPQQIPVLSQNLNQSSPHEIPTNRANNIQNLGQRSSNNFNSVSHHVANGNQDNQFQVFSSFNLPSQNVNLNSHHVHFNTNLPVHHSTNLLSNARYTESQNMPMSINQHQNHNVMPNFSHNVNNFGQHPVSFNNNVPRTMPPYFNNNVNIGATNFEHSLSSNDNHVDFSKVYFRLSQAHRNILKFDGKNQNLHNFLERVDEFCMAHRVNKDQLLNFAHELFEGDVLILFRSIRANCRTWQDLVNELKLVFLPSDFENDLWEAIKSRKQASTERVLIFIAVMENLFKRFCYPVEEQVQLKAIIKNLRPFYQDRLALNYPRSIIELKLLCKTLEDVKISNNSFKEPSNEYMNILGPELSVSKTQINKQIFKSQINEIFEESQVKEIPKQSIVNRESENIAETLSVTVDVVRSPKCWNCDIQGHAYNKCPKKKSLFCFGCGSKNIIKPKCPKCNPKNEVRTALQSEDAVVESLTPTTL